MSYIENYSFCHDICQYEEDTYITHLRYRADSSKTPYKKAYKTTPPNAICSTRFAYGESHSNASFHGHSGKYKGCRIKAEIRNNTYLGVIMPYRIKLPTFLLASKLIIIAGQPSFDWDIANQYQGKLVRLINPKLSAGKNSVTNSRYRNTGSE